MSTLLLSNEDVGKLIDLDEIYKAVEAGYASFSSGNVVHAPIVDLFKPGRDEMFDYKFCLDEKAGFFAMKSSSGGFSGNIAKGMLPGFNLVYLFDAETSDCACIMEGNYIRNLRTAAGAAIANNYLARKDASAYFAYGAGRIGKAAFRATARIRDLKDVWVFGWMEGENEAFIREMQPDFPGIRFHSCASPEEGARNTDIIVSVTLAKKGPVIRKEWLKRGTHVTAIGADNPSKQELYADVLEGAKVVNDSVEEASVRGETYHAIKEGYLKKEDIHAEIGEIILGKKPGRENDTEITVYDTVGMAIQDLSMAVCLYRKAQAAGIGTEFTFI